MQEGQSQPQAGASVPGVVLVGGEETGLRPLTEGLPKLIAVTVPPDALGENPIVAPKVGGLQG
jgi:hypothetical protein